MQQWNLHVQREVAGNIVLEAGYIGTKGSRCPSLPMPIRRLLDPRSPTRRQWTNNNATSLMTDIASSIYHGAQFKAEKRFSQDWLSWVPILQSQYQHRWRRIRDEQFAAGSTCIECDRALSAFNHTNIFALNWV